MLSKSSVVYAKFLLVRILVFFHTNYRLFVVKNYVGTFIKLLALLSESFV